MTRVGDLLNGDRFVTKLTHRSAEVLDASIAESDRGVRVRFTDDHEEKNVHVDVEVVQLEK
jgi:hypothetical protein